MPKNVIPRIEAMVKPPPIKTFELCSREQCFKMVDKNSIITKLCGKELYRDDVESDSDEEMMGSSDGDDDVQMCSVFNGGGVYGEYSLDDEDGVKALIKNERAVSRILAEKVNDIEKIMVDLKCENEKLLKQCWEMNGELVRQKEARSQEFKTFKTVSVKMAEEKKSLSMKHTDLKRKYIDAITLNKKYDRLTQLKGHYIIINIHRTYMVDEISENALSGSQENFGMIYLVTDENQSFYRIWKDVADTVNIHPSRICFRRKMCRDHEPRFIYEYVKHNRDLTMKNIIPGKMKLLSQMIRENKGAFGDKNHSTTFNVVESVPSRPLYQPYYANQSDLVKWNAKTERKRSGRTRKPSTNTTKWEKTQKWQ